MIWTLGSIASGVLGLILAIFVFRETKHIRFSPVESENTQSFTEQTLAIEQDLAGNHNQVYINNQENHTLVEKFIVSNEGKSRFLMIQLLQPLRQDQILDIHFFDSKGWIHTTRITAIVDTDQIPPLNVPKGTEHINFSTYNTADFIPEIQMDFKAKQAAFQRLLKLESLTFFLLAVPIGFGFLVLFGSPYYDRFFNWPTFGLGMTLMGSVTLVQYLFLRYWFTKFSRVWRSNHE